MSDDFDFGFSAVEDIETPAAVSAQTRLVKMHQMISHLLDNLAKDAHIPTINWPNRAERIKEFRKKIDQLLEQK